MTYNPSIVRAYFRECGLPEPVTEHKFASHIAYTDKAGRERTRKWAFDFAWPNFRVALEVEGGIWTGGRHTRGLGFKKDLEKYNCAAALGWRVLKVVPQNLCMDSTAKLIHQTLTA